MNDLSKVRRGIRFLKWHVHLFSFALVMVVIVVIVLSGDGPLRVVEPTLVMIAILSSVVLAFAGKFYCMSVPAESEGKGPIIFSVILDLIGSLIVIAGLLGLIPDPFGFMVPMLYLLSLIFLILFLRKLSIFLDLKKCRIHANLLLSFILIWYCAAMISMLTISTYSEYPRLSRLPFMVFFCASIAIPYIYISLIRHMMEAIDEKYQSTSSAESAPTNLQE